MDVFDLVARIGLDTSEYDNKLDESTKKGKGFGEKLAGVGKAAAKGFAIVTGAATAVVGGLLGVEAATEKCRVAMGKLNTAFDAAGLDADAAKKTYTEFYKILGDTDTATEASQLLAQLALSEEDLATWTNTAAGVMGTFGDSLPIEGLIESANETAKVGQITGSLADALNWVGISEDEFNEKLAACSDESERNRLIMETLSAQYSDAADSFNKNNEAIMQSRENQALLQETMAQIGGAVTNVKNAFLNEFAPAIANVGEKIAGFINGINVEAFSESFSEIGRIFNSVVTSIQTDGTFLNDLWVGLQTAAQELSTFLSNAFSLIVYAFSALAKQIETDGTWLNEIWNGLKEAAQALSDFLSAVWSVISAAFTWLVEQVQTEGTYFNMVWENIKLVVSSAVKVIEGVIKLFTAILKGDWSAAWEYCKNIASTIWNAITGIISNIVEWITGFLGTMVEKGSELINSLAEGIQNKFAELFTLVGGWVTDNIINPIADMGEDLYNAGVNLLNRFWDGLVSVWDKITKWWDKLKLSDKEANVRVNRDDDDGDRYATGLNYVPYDDFPAFLHRGEAVLTAAEARVWRNGGQGTTGASGGVIINQYIQSVPQTPVEFADTTAAYFEQARWAL